MVKVLKSMSKSLTGYGIEVSGTGAWKNLIVYSPEGELIVDKKFYKADFDQIMSDDVHGPWVDKLLEKAMIRKNQTDDPDIDPESYSEVEEVAKQVMDVHSDAFEMLANS